MRTSHAALVVALSSVLGLFACAPRNNKTYLDRWAEQTAQLHREEAAEKAEADKKAQRGSSVAPSSSGSRASGGSNLGGRSSGSRIADTPPIRTSTKSRVIRPVDTKKADDDDAVY